MTMTHAAKPSTLGLLLCAALWACGPGSDDTLETSVDEDSESNGQAEDESEDDGDSDSDETGDPKPEVCRCVDSLDECGSSASPCGSFAIECYENGCGEVEEDDQEYDIDEEALDCILVALRDRTPGRYEWVLGDPSDSWYRSTSLSILSDGTAISTGSGADDLDECPSLGTIVLELKDSTVFEQCRSETSIMKRAACLGPISSGLIASCEEATCYGEY
jgi:hypothetical protein